MSSRFLVGMAICGLWVASMALGYLIGRDEAHWRGCPLVQADNVELLPVFRD